MVWIWVIVGIIAAAAATYAFWPRRTGISDKDVRLVKRHDAGRSYYNH